MRKVFLDELPRKGKLINWKNSIGCKIPFIYGDIKGVLIVKGYIIENQKLIVAYNENEYSINTGSLTKCRLSIILGNYNMDYRYYIDERIVGKKRDLTIIDRKIRDSDKIRVYKYRCNKCGFECGEHYKKGEFTEELWVNEYSLKDGVGCSCCNSKIVANGINDIPTTAPWMVKYFQGGYNEAKRYAEHSNEKIEAICPNCKKISSIPVVINRISIQKGITCDFCSDNISYPEKVLSSVLNQLGVNYRKQLSSAVFEWCKKYRYDFYLPEYNTIIETHGRQHYEEFRGLERNLAEEQENDRIKKDLALNNSIKKYIELDCRRTNLEWIKNSIFDSDLSNMFNLNNVNWLKVEEHSLKNLIKEVCDYKKNNHICSAYDISQIFNISDSTIREYLKKGAKLGWCDYNAKEEYIKGVRKKNKWGKEVEIFKDEKSLGVFETCSELGRQSETLFGIKLDYKSICAVANGKRKTHKGFTFKYTEQLNNENQGVA